MFGPVAKTGRVKQNCFRHKNMFSSLNCETPNNVPLLAADGHQRMRAVALLHHHCTPALSFFDFHLSRASQKNLHCTFQKFWNLKNAFTTLKTKSRSVDQQGFRVR